MITGIKNMDLPEDRLFLYLKVIYNDNEYDWQIFCDNGVHFTDFLTDDIKQKIYTDIQNKENKWNELEPKYTVLTDPLTQEEIQVPINKEDIVKPDIPDYYAKRRAEYPAIGDQLDAFWKGPGSPEYVNMIEKINTIKNKYPK